MRVAALALVALLVSPSVNAGLALEVQPIVAAPTVPNPSPPATCPIASCIPGPNDVPGIVLPAPDDGNPCASQLDCDPCDAGCDVPGPDDVPGVIVPVPGGVDPCASQVDCDPCDPGCDLPGQEDVPGVVVPLPGADPCAAQVDCNPCENDCGVPNQGDLPGQEDVPGVILPVDPDPCHLPPIASEGCVPDQDDVPGVIVPVDPNLCHLPFMSSSDCLPGEDDLPGVVVPVDPNPCHAIPPSTALDCPPAPGDVPRVGLPMPSDPCAPSPVRSTDCVPCQSSERCVPPCGTACEDPCAFLTSLLEPVRAEACVPPSACSPPQSCIEYFHHDLNQSVPLGAPAVFGNPPDTLLWFVGVPVLVPQPDPVNPWRAIAITGTFLVIPLNPGFGGGESGFRLAGASFGVDDDAAQPVAVTGEFRLGTVAGIAALADSDGTLLDEGATEGHFALTAANAGAVKVFGTLGGLTFSIHHAPSGLVPSLGWKLGVSYQQNADLVDPVSGTNVGTGEKVFVDWNCLAVGDLDVSVGAVGLTISGMPTSVSGATFNYMNRPQASFYGVHWPGDTPVPSISLRKSGQALGTVTNPPTSFNLGIQTKVGPAPPVSGEGMTLLLDSLGDTDETVDWLYVSARLAGTRTDLGTRMGYAGTLGGIGILLDGIDDHLHAEYAMPATRPAAPAGEPTPVIPAFTLLLENPDQGKSDLTSSIVAHATFTIPGKAVVQLNDLRATQVDTRSEVNTKQHAAENQVGFGSNGRVEVTTLDDTPTYVLLEAANQDVTGRLLLTTCGTGFQDAYLDFQSTGAMHFLLKKGETRGVELTDLTGGTIDIAGGKGSIKFAFANFGGAYVDSSAVGVSNAFLLSDGGSCGGGGGGGGLDDVTVKADIKRAQLIDMSFAPVDLVVKEAARIHFTWRIAYDGGSITLDAVVHLGVTPITNTATICDFADESGCTTSHTETRQVDAVDLRPPPGFCNPNDFQMLRSGDKITRCWGLLTLEIPSDGSVEGTKQYAIQTLVDAYNTEQEVLTSPPSA